MANKERKIWFLTNDAERDPLTDPTHKVVVEDGKIQIFEVSPASSGGWEPAVVGTKHGAYGRDEDSKYYRAIGLLLDIVAAIREPDLVEIGEKENA